MSPAMIVRDRAVARLMEACPWIEDVAREARDHLRDFEIPKRPHGKGHLEQQHRRRWGLRAMLRLERRIAQLGGRDAARTLNGWVKVDGAPVSLDEAATYLTHLMRERRSRPRRRPVG